MSGPKYEMSTGMSNKTEKEELEELRDFKAQFQVAAQELQELRAFKANAEKEIRSLRDFRARAQSFTFDELINRVFQAEESARYLREDKARDQESIRLLTRELNNRPVPVPQESLEKLTLENEGLRKEVERQRRYIEKAEIDIRKTAQLRLQLADFLGLQIS